MGKMKIRWISTNEQLPNNGDLVLVIHGMEIETAQFAKGISKQERELMENGKLPNQQELGWCLADGLISSKRSRIFKPEDEEGNNLVPYCWRVSGNRIFGQDIEYWAKLPNLQDYQ